MERKTMKKNNKLNEIECGNAQITSTKTWKGDEKNIALLLLLYTLQGIPLGLSMAIPMILQSRGVSYKQQAEFNIVNWPFSLKLLWAPLVDCYYSNSMGRRKTWLIPTQYLIGLFMLFLSRNVDQWLGDSEKSPNVGILTALFFLLNFFAATQDIVVDGWALTMLKKANIGHASTCNSIGQTAGFFLSFVLFLALESAEFCNAYLRTVPQQTGMVTLSGFLQFWGWIFIIVTTIVGIGKKETIPRDSEHETPVERDLNSAYRCLKDILSLKSVQVLVLLLLTCKIGFSSTDSVMTLKLVESGIPKERLGLMTIPLIPIQIAMPLLIAKHTTGPKPLQIWLKAAPYRLLFGLVAAFLVWITPIVVPNPHDGLPPLYVLFLFTCYALHQICVYSMFVSIMAFFAKISDSSLGGTYMTLLNTVTNLGGVWPSTLALYFVDSLTWRKCVGGTESFDNLCRDIDEKHLCTSQGGECVTQIDGFYIETIICIIIGYIWLLWGRKKINHLQNLSSQAWKLTRKQKR